MNDDLPVSNSERAEALTWMREVLITMVEICPLSYRQKRQTSRYLNKIPDWLMARWADELNIDYIGGSIRYPDMAQQANSDVVRDLAQRYLEAHDAVPVGNCLEELSKSVVKHTQAGDLPVDSEIVERQVCALALAGCNAEGAEFAENARDILSDAEKANHPIVDYHLALEYGNKLKFEALDAALTGGRYGSWVAERLTEAKRFLGIEPPRFTIRYGERTPRWDLLWKKLFTGGDE
ncbi:hypothetical protein ACFLV0_03775 [Chloroflexota bacterium]